MDTQKARFVEVSTAGHISVAIPHRLLIGATYRGDSIPHLLVLIEWSALWLQVSISRGCVARRSRRSNGHIIECNVPPHRTPCEPQGFVKLVAECILQLLASKSERQDPWREILSCHVGWFRPWSSHFTPPFPWTCEGHASR